MAKYRKKPVVIEAWQWNGEPVDTSDDRIYLGGTEDHGDGPQPYLVVVTINGPVIVHPGEWILYGVNKEVYPCAPDIFEATYEPVADEGPLVVVVS